MFVLARDLHMTVEDLGRRMKLAEFRHWQQLYAVEHDELEREMSKKT